MLNVGKNFKIILFADDTNIESRGYTTKEMDSDLEAINNWLEIIKLSKVPNLGKKFQMILKSLSTHTTFNLNSRNIAVNSVFKYLGTKLGKTTLFSHIFNM